MSLINDFFAATPDELTTLDTRSGPWPLPPPRPQKKRWWSRGEAEVPEHPPTSGPTLPIVEAKGILDVELASLETLLAGSAIEDLDALVDLIQDPIRQEPADNPEAWISPVSPGLAASLVDAEDEQIAAIVPRWLATDEMAQSGWSHDEAVTLLRDLRDLFRQATKDERNVYRWFSL